MQDSEGRTGKTQILELSREAVLMCVVPDDIRAVFSGLMDIIKNGKDKDRVSASRVLLEYSVPKPTQSTDVTSGGEKIKSIQVEYINASEDSSDKTPQGND